MKAIKFFLLCSWRVLNRESSSLLSFFCVGRGKETWWFFVFSVGFKEGSLEMSDWLEQPEEGGVDSNDQTKGKEEEEEEQGELLASIEAESSRLETELKGLMRLYVLMLFQRETNDKASSGEAHA